MIYTDFQSVPWCINGHVHTVLSSVLFKSPLLDTEYVEIDTEDGDFLTLEVTGRRQSKEVAVIFHGLEGHTRRYYVTQLAAELQKRDYAVVLVNFRGCGPKMNRLRRFYHSGETEDIFTVLKWVESSYPASMIHAAGFSLGASALFNFLYKYGKNHPLRSVAAISTPFELKKGSKNLEKGFNVVYTKRFLNMLNEKLKRKRALFPDIPIFKGSTLYQFDDEITAPLHGFRDAEEYYESCSSFNFVDQIETNAIVIHSEEDPMCPFELTPVKQIFDNPKLTPCFTRRGGHVGFWSQPDGWLNRTIADYFDTFKMAG